MSLYDLLEQDLDIICTTDEAGVAATVTPPGGVGVETVVIPEYREDLDNAQWRAALQRTAWFFVRAADVEPADGSTIEIGSDTWTVAKRIARYGTLIKVEARADLRPNFKR